MEVSGLKIEKNNFMNNHHLLIVGTGSVGQRHATNFFDRGCKISCFDPRKDRLDELSSKINTEKFLTTNHKDFKFIILRYFNVAGADPYLRSGQISKKSTHLIKILSEVIVGKKDNIEIFGNDYNTKDGTAIRDYIHVSDLADIHVKVANYLLKELKSNLFNCGYGKGFSVLDVINVANKICNNKIKYTFTKRRKGDVETLISDISKIKKYINWQPKFDNLEIIINSSLEWEKKINEKNS